VQRALTWTGPAMFVLWTVSWVILARFIPPPSPQRSPDHVVAALSNHTDELKVALLITMFASALLVPFCAVISSHIRRIEGYGGGALASTQITSAALLSLEFIIPLMVWQAAIYRIGPGSDAAVISALNDMGWLMFVVVIGSVEVQLLAIVVAVFTDGSERPVFPRWVGYLNAWLAAGILPAGFVLFFKHGPFAWNGIVGFFIPLTSYAVWMFSMFVVLRRAIAAELEGATHGME
jgi:hypothetical protein